jgi:hypothetical protein
LILNVGQQTEEALIGSVGVQFRMPFVVNGRTINPYLNITAEDDFIGNGRLIQFSATSAPLRDSNNDAKSHCRPYGIGDIPLERGIKGAEKNPFSVPSRSPFGRFSGAAHRASRLEKGANSRDMTSYTVTELELSGGENGIRTHDFQRRTAETDLAIDSSGSSGSIPILIPIRTKSGTA